MATAPGPNPPPPLAVPDSLPAWPPYTQDSNTAELQVAQGHRGGGCRVRGDSEHTQGWGQCEYHLPPVEHPGIALTTPAEPGDPHGLGKEIMVRFVYFRLLTLCFAVTVLSHSLLAT